MCSIVSNACRTKATSGTLGGVEVISHHNFGRLNALENQLCNTVTPLDCKLNVGKVEQHNANSTSIVGVNHACTDVDKVLHRQPAAWCNATIAANRHGN